MTEHRFFKVFMAEGNSKCIAHAIHFLRLKRRLNKAHVILVHHPILHSLASQGSETMYAIVISRRQISRLQVTPLAQQF